ncbi:MAG: hypothetical protein JWM68_5762 [Verrucomicrobiales bacterium]|nr:hypothetical protein [Verrucomicrobiales bacterium]
MLPISPLQEADETARHHDQQPDIGGLGQTSGRRAHCRRDLGPVPAPRPDTAWSYRLKDKVAVARKEQKHKAKSSEPLTAEPAS